MNFSFDLDGTITAHTAVFVAFGKALRAAGHRVTILTGIDLGTFHGRRTTKYPELADTSWYDDVVTADDYNANERALAAQVINGNLDNHILVGMFKRRICRERGIAAHFDDDISHVSPEPGTALFGVIR